MTTQNTVRVVVFDNQKEPYGRLPPTKAPAFFAWFKEKIDPVPEEFKSQTRIVLEPLCSDDGVEVHIVIFYERPENEAEIARREQRLLEQAERHRAYELQKLAELKEKYEK